MSYGSSAIVLPGLLQRRIDDVARSFLRPEPGYDLDFAVPKGEPALVGPDSVSWRVFKNPVALFIGGIAAVLMELAEPRVRDGVWQNTRFRTDALTRLRRTGWAAMVTVYAPRSKAEAMIAGVGRMHARIAGRTSEGESYRASDPELLDWVQATASFGFMQAYHAYARRLSLEERDALLREGRPVARLYGAVGAPASAVELYALFARMDRRLVPSPIILEFLEIMTRVPALPAPARPLQRLLVKGAVAILPHRLRARLELGTGWSLWPWDLAVVCAAAGAGDRIILNESPAVRSCRRLGLPADHLYRR